MDQENEHIRSIRRLVEWAWDAEGVDFLALRRFCTIWYPESLPTLRAVTRDFVAERRRQYRSFSGPDHLHDLRLSFRHPDFSPY